MNTFPKNIHCAGIGGIGLSALAQLLKHEGHVVTGSDRDESPVTEMLVSKGIDVQIGQTTESLPASAELLIFSDALSEDNPERVAAKERGIPSMSYFEALGKVSEGKRTVAISGTHGKTTTTAMITKILVDLGLSPTAIIGSLTKDFESNYVPGMSDIFVVEACEYRRHFLHFTPTITVVTNVELDHTDYFTDAKDFEDAFVSFMNRTEVGGKIVTDTKSTSIGRVLSQIQCEAEVIDYTTAEVPGLSLIGEFNRQNARAAKAAVKALIPDADEAIIDASLESFHGTWRRFEYKGKTVLGAEVYDDYAHHPTAIAATIAATKEKFPEKLITVVFQPHLYSRTKSLLSEFAKSLETASDVVLLPIYDTKKKVDETVSSEILAKEIQKLNPGMEVKVFKDRTLAVRYLLQICKDDTVIITMGAGTDAYAVAEELVASSISTS
mgnify:FL=1